MCLANHVFNMSFRKKKNFLKDARVRTCSFILNTILLYSLLTKNVRRPEICAAGGRRRRLDKQFKKKKIFREIPGFVLNRMQYALLNECWRLIRDGVVSPHVSTREITLQHRWAQNS
jgi:hypothetical protein